MIMEAREFTLHARIDSDILNAWLEAGWLMPNRKDEGTDYSDVDLARAHLIGDLQHLGINDEGVPVILDLVDKIHGLRRVVRHLLTAIKDRPPESGRE
jgi:chaperone modulatory protein CbpM